MMAAVSQYTCIQCGASAPQLYKELRPGIIQISQCSHCSRVVDKYIEYDSVIILLDALLHKSQAYRHLLFNSSFNSPWKLLVILLLCDAYIKWDHQKPMSVGTHHHEILDAALEWHFYRAFALAMLEWLVFTGALLSLLAMRDVLWTVPTDSNTRVTKTALVKGMIMSSCGKLLAIPAMIWGQTHSPLYLLLTKVLIFTSNVTALSVLSAMGRAGAGLLLVASLSLQHTVSMWLTQSNSILDL